MNSMSHTSATFTGVPGHTYVFFSIARDASGISEPMKTTADIVVTNSTQAAQFASTTTSAISVNGNSATFSGQGNLNGQAGYNFTVTAKDGGGAGLDLDTVSIAITGPNNFSYTAEGTIAGGDIVVIDAQRDCRPR